MKTKLAKPSPMVAHYLQMKEKYPDCILFYRLGDFYEMFFEDAKLVSKELDLVLTGKDCGLEERAPMCGIPFHAYESYAQRLVERGYKIAICEQLSAPTAGKLVERDVVRIITPGTIIDSSMLNEAANTYIMSIYRNRNVVSYAYSDISTGEINVAVYEGDNYLNYINDQIVRIMPSEIICNPEAKVGSESLPCLINGNLKFNEYYDWAYSYPNAESRLLKQYHLSSLKGFDFNSKPAVICVGALIEYFIETQKRELKHLKLPKLIVDNQFMYLDTNTRRNLEIEQTMREGGRRGSLLWVLDDTCTSGGARLLKNWVRQPLQNLDEINQRLDLVECLYNNAIVRKSLYNSLTNVQDIERIVGRISYGNISPKECLSLANSLAQVPTIKKILLSTENNKFAELANQLVDTSEIVNLINSTISPDAPTLLKDGGYIRSGFNQALDDLRNMKSNAEDVILSFQAREREATGIKNLKIGYNRVFGYFIEINKQFQEKVPFNYIRKQTISNNERYITEELKKLEEEILTSHEKALKLEEVIFTKLKEQLLTNCEVMQNIAITLAKIDCLYSLAEVASKNDYTRPVVTNNSKINIVSGRHPVIEKLFKKEDFIPNDCLLNNTDQRTMLLTGPNMAGKSTYMRQVALITYLAHIGSFVPAQKAEICLVDRIFTRIGASDDLAVGQSTFMVEMIEVANILNFATNNSLIILDEVGRGTSTFDGLSIAWAVIEYLSKNLNAKTLFATHYHELMQMEGLYDGVKNFCISIKEIGGQLVFLRKIMRGSATKSYGIEVASLAGLPKSIIARSKELISEFEKEKTVSTKSQESEIVDILKNIDINTLSPLVAFDTLSHLIDLVK